MYLLRLKVSVRWSSEFKNYSVCHYEKPLQSSLVPTQAQPDYRPPLPRLAQQPKRPRHCMEWLHPRFQSSICLRRNQDLLSVTSAKSQMALGQVSTLR